MMERHQGFRPVGITPVMQRSDACLDCTSAHYNAPGDNGIEENERPFSEEEKGRMPNSRLRTAQDMHFNAMHATDAQLSGALVTSSDDWNHTAFCWNVSATDNPAKELGLYG